MISPLSKKKKKTAASHNISPNSDHVGERAECCPPSALSTREPTSQDSSAVEEEIRSLRCGVDTQADHERDQWVT